MNEHTLLVQYEPYDRLRSGWMPRKDLVWLKKPEKIPCNIGREMSKKQEDLCHQR